jgi:leucyl/phenylalanyl-tRNA--protein transferase
MPVFRLSKELIFPPCQYAEPDGLLAIGGDLSEERLLLAYRLGIFPWYSKDTPILWWAPDPRLVLFPHELRIAKSLKRVIKKGSFQVTIDRAFLDVITRCADVRECKGEETWILPEMIQAYFQLHKRGYAHSVETWHDGRLVGGLYGVVIGRVFFGESMFTEMTDASKVAFVHLVQLLQAWKFELIDCQVTTVHLQSFGAREIPRREFMIRLSRALGKSTSHIDWSTVDFS